MKTATIRQIRNDLNTVLEWVAKGQEVVVTRRRRPVARLLPPRADDQRPVVMPDFARRLSGRFGNKRMEAVKAIIEEREAGRW